MDVFNIIDGINAKKAEMKMTNQQVANAAGVPESTVNRILRKETTDPRIQSVLAIAEAVGYDFSAPGAQSIGNEQEGQYIRHIISMYQAQIADLKRANNQLRAEKNRTIDILSTVLGVAIGGWICIYMMDITNPHAGWFQDQGQINISVLMLAILIAFAIVFITLKKRNRKFDEE